MSYDIGQILYVVFKKDHKVIPAQVSEEITKKTADGLRVDYTINVGTSKDSALSLALLLEEAEVFSSAEEAIETLSSKARASITKLVESASEKALIWYGNITPTSSSKHSAEENVVRSVAEDLEESVKVVLPDGTIARAKLPKAM